MLNGWSEYLWQVCSLHLLYVTFGCNGEVVALLFEAALQLRLSCFLFPHTHSAVPVSLDDSEDYSGAF